MDPICHRVVGLPFLDVQTAWFAVPELGIQISETAPQWKLLSEVYLEIQH
jgi:hypothetical protein